MPKHLARKPAKKRKLGNEVYRETALGSEITEKQKKLIAERSRRLLSAWEFGKGASAGTLAAFGVQGKFALSESISAGAAGFISRYFLIPERNKSIKEINYQLGSLLKKEAKTNNGLREFLEKYRYVFFDLDGKLTGTDRPRLLKMGRFRLKAKKILEGVY